MNQWSEIHTTSGPKLCRFEEIYCIKCKATQKKTIQKLWAPQCVHEISERYFHKDNKSLQKGYRISEQILKCIHK